MFNTHLEDLQFLKDNGWSTVPFALVNIDQLETVYNQAAQRKATLPFDVDGAVFIVNEKNIQEQLGCATKYPRYALAAKFENERAVAVVTGITWQVGRTGKITPLCHIEPTELAGAIVRKASMANMEIMRTMGKINVGCRVIMERANDVIPHVYGVHEAADKMCDIPSNCPICNSTLDVDGPNLFCRNVECEARITGKISHFVSTVDIEHLGTKTVEAISAANLIEDLADLYDKTKINPKALMDNIDRMGENAYKICSEIDKHRSIPFGIFLASLGIKMCGKRTSNLIADYYKTFDNFIAALKANKSRAISCVEGVGDIATSHIYMGLGNNWTLIKKFLTLGVTIESVAQKVTKNGKLKDKTFVLTGAMEKKRADIVTDIENAGGIAQERVGKDTNYLVCNATNSSKLDKARKLGTKIITEQDLYKMME